MAKYKCLNCMKDYDDELSSTCPECGYDKNTEKKESYHLDPGYLLYNRYIIGNVIGSGGFGITYVAWDNVLSKKVAIKEYFPSEFATRLMGTTEVCSYDGEKSYQFEAGLNGFVDEALRLAKLNKMEGIVHIFDSFVENCTAYIVMEYVEGETLMQLLKKNGPLPYQDVVKYIVPVLRALHEVHKEGIIHRDIAPDNIKINGETVTLLDFGAARSATTTHSKSLSVIYKRGYTPEEQYRSNGKQGPWTDVYAVAAVMYHLITGKIPDESIERNIKDELKTPTALGFVLPVPLENAIMNALNVKAEYRIQSAGDFADALSGVVEVERVIDKRKSEDAKLSPKVKIASAVSSVVAVILIIAIIVTTSSINSFNEDGEALPNLLGANEKQVESLLKDIGLGEENYKIVGILKNVDGDPGTIVDQNIEPGQIVFEDIVVELKMAEIEVVKADKTSDKATMPLLTAMTRSEAEAALKKAGFTKITFGTKLNNNYDEGLVCEQSLASGKKYKKDTAVVVYIAENDEETTQKANETTQKSPETTKKVEKVTKSPETTAKANNPKPATTAPVTKAPETAASNKITVPNLVGFNSSSAQSIIRGKGLYVQTISQNTGDSSLDGKVISTSPGGGSLVEAGTLITVYVYRYDAQMDIPTTVLNTDW